VTGGAWPDAGEAETGGRRPGVGDGRAPNTLAREEGETPATAAAQGVYRVRTTTPQRLCPRLAPPTASAGRHGEERRRPSGSGYRPTSCATRKRKGGNDGEDCGFRAKALLRGPVKQDGPVS
jgi:hypothetical protein